MKADIKILNGIDQDSIVKTVLGALGIATPARFSIEERASQKFFRYSVDQLNVKNS